MAISYRMKKTAQTTVSLLGSILLLLLLVYVWHSSSTNGTSTPARLGYSQRLLLAEDYDSTRTFNGNTTSSDVQAPTVSVDASTQKTTDILQDERTSQVDSGLNQGHDRSEQLSREITTKTQLQSLTKNIPTKIVNVSSNTTQFIAGNSKTESSTISNPESKLAINRWSVPPNFPWWSKDIDIEVKTVLLTLPWVHALKSYLMDTANPRYPIAIVTSNSEYKAVLVNWLISALVELEDPIQNVLVLSLDRELDDFLRRRNISSICVPQMARIKKNQFLKIRQIEVARLFAMRLLTYWGYSVINYDSDAIVLRNPQPLFDKHSSSDVIASAGYMPKNLYEKWGFSLCMGVVLFRPSEQTEILWKAMARFEVGDDQRKLNSAINYLNTTWEQRATTHSPWTGHTRQNLTITVLHQSLVCRGPNCAKAIASSYYIWHKGGDHDYSAMIRGAHAAKVWFLDRNWEEKSQRNSNLMGREWLREISRKV